MEKELNERIKQLMNQTGVPVSMPFDKWCEKFAELIVRECASVELYWLSEQDRKAVAEKIKQHFGVED